MMKWTIKLYYYFYCTFLLLLAMLATSSTCSAIVHGKCNNALFASDVVSNCSLEYIRALNNSCQENNESVVENVESRCTIYMQKASEIADSVHEHILSFKQNKHVNAVTDNMAMTSNMLNNSYLLDTDHQRETLVNITSINERIDNKTESSNNAVKEASTSERLRLLGIYTLSLVIIWVVLLIFIKRGARNAHQACYTTQDVVVVDVANCN